MAKLEAFVNGVKNCWLKCVDAIERHPHLTLAIIFILVILKVFR